MDNNEMFQPLISIIITSYNYSMFLPKTIDSCLNQSYENYEVWVIDGGSTDSTVEILKGYGNKIKWISEPDNGETDAMNKGLKLIKGEIVNFQCADNYFNPGVFQLAVDTFKKTPDLEMIFSDFLVHDHNDKFKYSIIHKNMSFNSLLNERPYMAQSAAFIKKETLDRVGPFNLKLKYANDHEMWLRILQSSKARYVEFPIAVYIEHDKTITNSKRLATLWEGFRVNMEYGAKLFSKANKFFLIISLRSIAEKILGTNFINVIRKFKGQLI